MGERGRKSAESLSVVKPDFARAKPPKDLTESEASIWERTVSSEPPDLFSSAATKDMLKFYCCHLSEAERITATIRQFKTEWLKNEAGMKRYHALLRARGEEAANAARLAGKLRLTNQSRYRPDTAGLRKRQLMPWEFDGTETSDDD